MPVINSCFIEIAGRQEGINNKKNRTTGMQHIYLWLNHGVSLTESTAIFDICCFFQQK